jgi:hypothetical protein
MERQYADGPFHIPLTNNPLVISGTFYKPYYYELATSYYY